MAIRIRINQAWQLHVVRNQSGRWFIFRAMAEGQFRARLINIGPIQIVAMWRSYKRATN